MANRCLQIGDEEPDAASVPISPQSVLGKSKSNQRKEDNRVVDGVEKSENNLHKEAVNHQWLNSEPPMVQRDG